MTSHRQPFRIEVPRADAIAVGLISIVAVVLFSPGLILGKVPAFRDALGFTMPSRLVWQKAALAGHLSQWNPFVGLGLPTMSVPVGGTAYPPNVILLLGAFSTTFTLLWIAHAWWAGLGGYVLGRVTGCRPAASMLSGLFWIAGGYSVSMWGNGEKVLTCAWIPWLAVCTILAARAGTISVATAAAAVTFAMIGLAGDPFVWLDALLLAVALCLAERAFTDWRGRLIRISGVFGLTVGLGALVSALSLIPAFLLRGNTERRVAAARSVAEQWSFHPARLVELIIPGALGDPMDLDRYSGALLADNPFEQALPWAISIYAGAAVWVFVWFGGKNRRTIAMALAAIASLLLALGHHTFAHQLARNVIPGLALSRYPEKHIIVFLAALALIASHGIERVLSGAVRVWWPLLVVALGPLVALALSPSVIRPTVLHGLPYTYVFASICVACVWVATKRRSFEFVIPVAIAADCVIAAFPLLKWAESSTISTESEVVTEALSRRQPYPPRVLRSRVHDYLDPATLPDNAGTYFGIANLDGHDSASWNGLSKFVGLIAHRGLAAFRLLGADFLLDSTPGGLPGLVALQKTGDWTIYDLPKWPRAWLVSRVVELPGEKAAAAIADASFNPDQVAIVEPGEPVVLPESGMKTRPGRCSVEQFHDNRIDLGCQSTSDAFLVVAEAFAPGWRASIDGHDAAVVRTNVVMRGLRLEAGKHAVVFRYSTPGLALGSELSALGLAGCAAIVVIARRRKRRSNLCANSP